MILGKLDVCLWTDEFNPCFSLFTQIYSKCIKDLNVRPENLKLPEG